MDRESRIENSIALVRGTVCRMLLSFLSWQIYHHLSSRTTLINLNEPVMPHSYIFPPSVAFLAILLSEWHLKKEEEEEGLPLFRSTIARGSAGMQMGVNVLVLIGLNQMLSAKAKSRGLSRLSFILPYALIHICKPYKETSSTWYDFKKK